jgi:succinate dehydrogenase hydrophobic anchor subunit
MSTQITRAGRARPQGGGFELAIWYLMRLTGLGLFVTALAHYTIMHFVYDPAIQTADWVTARWASLGWRTVDWLMLSFVTFHAFMGIRTIVHDYTKGGLRTFLTMGLYLGMFIIFVLGTIVVVTLPFPGE